MEGGAVLADLILLAFSLVLYFLPAIIASHRGHNSRGSIFVVNLFLGWTLLIWILCLAWSFGGNTEARDRRLAQDR